MKAGPAKLRGQGTRQREQDTRSPLNGNCCDVFEDRVAGA